MLYVKPDKIMKADRNSVTSSSSYTDDVRLHSCIIGMTMCNDHTHESASQLRDFTFIIYK